MDLELALRIAKELGITPEEFQRRKDYLLLGEQRLAARTGCAATNAPRRRRKSVPD